MRKLHRVSTKAAFFDLTHEHVVVIDMHHDDQWGLPGGHVEDGETPDVAIARELLEECGITADSLVHKDFFVHNNGKIVLAYIGEISDTQLISQQDNAEGVPKWITLSEFKTKQIDPSYREFVLKNWPE